MVGGEDGEMGRASRAGPGTSWQSYFKCAGTLLGFSGGSDGKESACNAGFDLGSIRVSGRSPREGNCYPF